MIIQEFWPKNFQDLNIYRFDAHPSDFGCFSAWIQILDLKVQNFF